MITPSPPLLHRCIHKTTNPTTCLHSLYFFIGSALAQFERFNASHTHHKDTRTVVLRFFKIIHTCEVCRHSPLVVGWPSMSTQRKESFTRQNLNYTGKVAPGKKKKISCVVQDPSIILNDNSIDKPRNKSLSHYSINEVFTYSEI